MVAYETYANALITKGHGHPLWEPDPGEYAPVELGDVGYLDNGGFVKIFNASKDVHDWSNRLGLPRGHSPLHIGDILRPTPLSKAPEHISSEGVSEKGADLSVTTGTFGQAGGGFSFECSHQQGALLIMGDVAYRQNAVDKKRFSEYMLQHHRSWLDFAEALGRDVSLSDLILVNGCDKTSEWACAAWSEKTQCMRLSFVAGVPGIAEGSAGLWGRWISSQSLDKNVGPRPLMPAIGAPGTSPQLTSSESMSIDEPSSVQVTSSHSSMRSPSYNQCVFVRGFQMGERTSWFKHKKTRIDVGNGFVTVRKLFDSKKTSRESSIHSSPQQQLDGVEDKRTRSPADYSGSDEELDIETNGQQQCTPAEAMIGYIFEKSTAKLALVHHDDLGDLLKENSYIDIGDFSVWIRQVAPRVYLDDNVGMLKGTFDLRTSPDDATSRNVHPNECMPSSSQDGSPNLEAISAHQQRFGRHPTDVDMNQLKMVSDDQRTLEGLVPNGMDASPSTSLEPSPSMLHDVETLADLQPNDGVSQKEVPAEKPSPINSREYTSNMSEKANIPSSSTNTDISGPCGVQKRSGGPKSKNVVRTKSGCYTCRIRRKKCDEKPDRDGRCETCVRLYLECLGFGAKRPDWLRDNRNVLAVRERIKTHLLAQGMIKGYSGAGPSNAERETPILRMHDDINVISSTSTTPTLSIDDNRRPGLTVSSARDDSHQPSLDHHTSRLIPRIGERIRERIRESSPSPSVQPQRGPVNDAILRYEIIPPSIEPHDHHYY